MFDRLPPLQTLRAFEATARLMSMTLAAEELHVTHGAVSRHVKTLETHLGVPLFRRLTRRIVLTDEGAEFHAAVARLLGELTREAERLRANESGSRMTISTSVSFASKWLAPRLHSLKTLHPELDIHLDVTDLNVDLEDGLVDAAVRYGAGRYAGAQSERILEEFVTPVCSTRYRDEMGGLPDPASLTRCTLLHEARMLANWDQWFAFAGVDRRRTVRGSAYSHGSMAIEAAIRGEGVALGRSVLVRDDIMAGRLVAPFPQLQLKAERGYDLVYRVGSRDDRKVKVLRDWLTSEVQRFLAKPG
ncbi:LysR family transcriptional regulator [Burkholderia sp. SRS-W-2-2016]|uniref:transcriptional regulator GcvA n=1 Tax=Burkholderia sp. SRS-W-2-2016 TaxID=1926878 RepID=UPI00094B18CC|nr:transcriptional regulator GcvA [Burkholderia sp. SRS-W-2-2016]OLL27187.1 LysR family transcriptional regulator [Burkholderia sp. SRS-W-2-2016]